jgi:hypothetical protein
MMDENIAYPMDRNSIQINSSGCQYNPLDSIKVPLEAVVGSGRDLHGFYDHHLNPSLGLNSKRNNNAIVNDIDFSFDNHQNKPQTFGAIGVH